MSKLKFCEVKTYLFFKNKPFLFVFLYLCTQRIGVQKSIKKTESNRKSLRVGKILKIIIMIKKMKTLVALVAVVAMMSSCAMVSSPLIGAYYTDVKSPVAVTGNSGSSKVGKAEAKSILGIIATGDASVQAAAQSAGIKKIHHVDQHATSILGIIASYTVYVYGE